MLEKFKSVDVALYIFLLSGLGYLITFLYEWGYNSYFNLPIEFVELSITTITKSIVLLGIFVSAYFSYKLFFVEKTDVSDLLNNRFSKTVFDNKYVNHSLQFICLIVMAYLAYLYSKDSDHIKILYVFQALLLLYIYCLLKKYSKMALITILCVFILVPYIAGISNAKNKDLFYKVKMGDKYYIILDYYDKKAVVAEVDLENKELQPVYKLYSLSDMSKEKKELELIKIDNLKVKKIESIK
jgi:hypothetical protein